MITRRQAVTATNTLNADSKPVTLASHLLQAFKRTPPHPQGVCPRKRFRRNLYRVTRSLGAVGRSCCWNKLAPESPWLAAPRVYSVLSAPPEDALWIVFVLSWF